jgi:hypothetical protein
MPVPSQGHYGFHSFPSSQNEHITRAKVEMVVLDYMPLKLVEGKGFLNLMSILAPDYKVPSRKTIKKICK